jgi:acylphosphatase
MTSKRLEARVHGRVQGVGFRWWVSAVAKRLALVGWVRNDSSGSVSLVVEGAPEAVDELAAELHRGPSGAFVERVDPQYPPATGEFSRFDIRSGGHSGD